jgi:hypothetical protein
MYRLDNSSYVAMPDLRSESYQELESSGRLALLRDAQLRSGEMRFDDTVAADR